MNEENIVLVGVVVEPSLISPTLPSIPPFTFTNRSNRSNRNGNNISIWIVHYFKLD
nr:exosporium leader peptide-containing protein [Bacillus mycoides]